MVTKNTHLCLILAITSSKGGPLTKYPKNIFIKIFVFNSLKAILHRKEGVKHFPMRISKLQWSDVTFIASHILKVSLKENKKESPTANMEHCISQTSQKQHTMSIWKLQYCDLRYDNIFKPISWTFHSTKKYFHIECTNNMFAICTLVMSYDLGKPEHSLLYFSLEDLSVE